MSDIVERLRDHATDWNGAQMPDIEPAKGDPTAGTLCEAAAELTRLRADLAAVERERDALIKALERLASPETFYAGGRVAPETFARMTYAKHILAGKDASDAKSFAIVAGFERAVNGAVDARAALEKPHG